MGALQETAGRECSAAADLSGAERGAGRNQAGKAHPEGHAGEADATERRIVLR